MSLIGDTVGGLSNIGSAERVPGNAEAAEPASDPETAAVTADSDGTAAEIEPDYESVAAAAERASNPETAAVTADTAVETATAPAAAAVTAEPAGTAAETETDYIAVAAAAEAVADTAAAVSMTAD